MNSTIQPASLVLSICYGTSGGHAQAQLTAQVPGDIASLVVRFLGERITEAEHFCVLSLTAKNQVMQLEVVHIGNLVSSMVCPQRVFRTALLANAASIVVAHNHPSGDCTPSPEDIDVTQRLVELGRKLAVPVLDHVIVTDKDYRSLNTLGYVS